MKKPLIHFVICKLSIIFFVLVNSSIIISIFFFNTLDFIFVAKELPRGFYPANCIPQVDIDYIEKLSLFDIFNIHEIAELMFLDISFFMLKSTILHDFFYLEVTNGSTSDIYFPFKNSLTRLCGLNTLLLQMFEDLNTDDALLDEIKFFNNYVRVNNTLIDLERHMLNDIALGKNWLKTHKVNSKVEHILVQNNHIWNDVRVINDIALGHTWLKPHKITTEVDNLLNKHEQLGNDTYKVLVELLVDCDTNFNKINTERRTGYIPVTGFAFPEDYQLLTNNISFGFFSINELAHNCIKLLLTAISKEYERLLWIELYHQEDSKNIFGRQLAKDLAEKKHFKLIQKLLFNFNKLFIHLDSGSKTSSWHTEKCVIKTSIENSIDELENYWQNLRINSQKHSYIRKPEYCRYYPSEDWGIFSAIKKNFSESKSFLELIIFKLRNILRQL